MKHLYNFFSSLLFRWRERYTESFENGEYVQFVQAYPTRLHRMADDALWRVTMWFYHRM